MNKPQSISINNKTVFSAEELLNYDKGFFIGCSRVRLIIEKKRLQENDYIFAYQKNNIWIISSYEYPRAKLYLTEQYVITNVPKMMPEINSELYQYQETPKLLLLNDNEKLKNISGKIIEIEIRGERKHNECYFKVKDISIGLDIPNLQVVININTETYIKNIHYKTFNVINERNNKNKIYIFLTFAGFQKLINVSRNNFNPKLIFTMTKWLQQFDDTILNNYNLSNIKNLRKKVGYVYCVESSNVDVIKIGCWRGSINRLRQRYHTYYGDKINVYYFYTKDPRKLENECHKYFDEYKICYELFRKDQLQEYIKYLELNQNPPTNDDTLSDDDESIVGDEQSDTDNDDNNTIIEEQNNKILSDDETIRDDNNFYGYDSNLLKMFEDKVIELKHKLLMKDKDIELMNIKHQNALINIELKKKENELQIMKQVYNKN